MANPVLCIGSMHWDVIGNTTTVIDQGDDVPGSIVRHPGGVALNVARGLRKSGINVVMLASVGSDTEGDELLEFAASKGIDTNYVHRSHTISTDRYVAVEDRNGLVGAVADMRNLESSTEGILAPLEIDQLASSGRTVDGTVVIDGNLPDAAINRILELPTLNDKDLRVVAPSHPKVKRLRGFLSRKTTTLYLNLNEASHLGGVGFSCARSAAARLASSANARIVVTDGRREAALAKDVIVLNSLPKRIVTGGRVTGAGDALAAGHISAELNGAPAQKALDQAVDAAVRFLEERATANDFT